MMQWKPKLPASGSLHERIVLALERDIRSGAIKNGTKLPPQRTLADFLNISVGTVTKAYLEAERRGIARAHVGRGTYVKSLFDDNETLETYQGRIIDLSVNIVPHNATVPYFIDYRVSALQHSEALEILAYAPPAGPDDQRRAAAAWLGNVANFDCDWTRIIQTTGAQHAMALAFENACKPGDTILCEAATFYGMKALADFKGYKLHAVNLDNEGVVPADLEKACAITRASVLYVMPTAQNPTARTMGKARRQAIAKIARRNNLWVVEDDVYALFGNGSGDDLRPIASLLPDRTFYIGGISKSLAPGLRLGFLVCPTAATFDSIIQAIVAGVGASSALGGFIFSQWMQDGVALKIGAVVRDEIAKRTALAQKILGPIADTKNSAPHLWLSLAKSEAGAIYDRAMELGLKVTPPDAPIVSGRNISGLRICLGTASSTEQLTVALARLKAAIQPKAVLKSMI